MIYVHENIPCLRRLDLEVESYQDRVRNTQKEISVYGIICVYDHNMLVCYVYGIHSVQFYCQIAEKLLVRL
jgi:hypothetical protein